MDSFLRNLKEQVTCSICLDIYNEPKTISCLHTFCCECLSNHARRSHRQGKFKCPDCRVVIDLPEGNRFDNLPTRLFLKNLVNLHAHIGDGRNITCGFCESKNSDVHYCFDCAKFMCPLCLYAHEVIVDSFKGHKVMPVKDFQAEDYEALLKRQPPAFCSQQYHEREITRFFCILCQSCVCHICIVTDHRNHEVILLDKAAENEKENIRAKVAMIKEGERAIMNGIQKFEEMTIKTLGTMESSVLAAQHKRLRTIEQMIGKHGREAKTSIEPTRVMRLQNIIKSAGEETMSLLEHLRQVREFAQKLVEESSSSEVMQNKETCLMRSLEVSTQAAQHNETSFIQFTATAAQGLTLSNTVLMQDSTLWRNLNKLYTDCKRLVYNM